MLSSRRSSTTALGLGLVAALVLAACGGGSDVASDTAVDAAPTAGEFPADDSTVAAPDADAGAEPAAADADGATGEPATGPAPASPLTGESVLAILGATTDVSATVSAVGAFPTLPTPPDAEIVHVSSQLVDAEGTPVDRVAVRYLTTIDAAEVATFFDSAATSAGWEGYPGDTASYGGSSTVFYSEYDVPGGDDQPEIEVTAETWDDTLIEISIRSELTAAGGMERFEQLLTPVPLPEGSLSILEAGFSASTVSDGVRETRRLLVTYPTEVSALQEQIVGLVGSPSQVAPVDPGPGVVEAEAVGPLDYLRYESWLGLYGASDASVASSVAVDAEWLTAG